MASSIDRLQEDGITVILIGFPQQNFAWDQESVDATRKYNEAMRKLAQENRFILQMFSMFIRRLVSGKICLKMCILIFCAALLNGGIICI